MRIRVCGAFVSAYACSCTSTPNIAQINMDNLVLLSDRSLCIIFSTGAYRRDSVMVRERDWRSSVHGFESH